MSSIRKWLASKVFSSVLSNDAQLNESSSTDGISSLFGSSFPGSGSSSVVDSSIFRSIAASNPSQDVLSSIQDTSSENQSYFSVIYHHYKSRMRQNIPNTIANEKVLAILMYQFYHANEELNLISSELDTFDGRKDTDRCSALVNSLKIAQDRVISLIFRIMDEIGCERASREYRLKFPDELLTGEGIESLNSQIWFGAECLTGGSTITNNQDKSNYLRPIAKNLTTTLDQIRYELRSCCNYLPKNLKIPKDLIRKLESFDNLFSSFEYDYVKAMLQIKTCEDIENLQELTFLFSETLSYALKKGLISKDDVDGCQPSVMIALPRLSIVRGLLQGYGSVVCKLNPDELTTILKPYHSLLLEFYEFLMNLNDEEIFFLEKLLSTNHENIDLSDNNPSLPLMDVGPNNQDSLLTVFNKFFRHAKRMKDSGPRTHQHKKSMQGKFMINRYISASVDFLMINNTRNDTCSDESSNNNNLYSPFKSNEMLFRFNSLPNINFYSTKSEVTNFNNFETINSNQNQQLRSHTISSTSPDYSISNSTNTTSTSSCPSVSITCSSSSSISVELDFLKQFKDMLKRTQLKTLTKNHNFQDQQLRSTSSGFYPNYNYYPVTMNEMLMNPRAKTALTDNIDTNIHFENFKPNTTIFTPTTSAFSNNSIHFDLDTFYTDDLSQLTVYTKKILHQVFVMISRIADEFQTNYASELRNILRTVFLLQDTEETLNDSSSLIRPVDVQIGHLVNEDNNNVDNLDNREVEEAIDACNEYLCAHQENCSYESIFPSTSHSSHNNEQQFRMTISETNNCDNMNMNTCCDLYRTSSLENILGKSEIDSQVPSNSCGISSSFPSFNNNNQGSITMINNNNNNSNKPIIHNGGGGTSSSFVDQKNLRQLRQSNISINSSNSLNSCRGLQQSQVTLSATTIDESSNHAELPQFIFSNSTSNSSPALSSPMLPILGSVSGPSSSSATNLLLPPIWIPDDLVTTCKSCAQGFNLIRRRHHCRRCGQIFCHQCSNNFISLKCFGYAKPVRVCNPCLMLHKQSEQRTESQIPNTTFGAS